MLVDWQTLGLVQVHARHDSDVGDADFIAGDVLVVCKRVVQDAGELIPSHRLLLDDLLIWLLLEQWLHHILDEVDVAALEPHR